MKRKLLALLLSLALTLPLAACGGAAAPSAEPSPSPAAQTVEFTDSVGRTVELPAEISRIAPSGPLAQMVLFALAPDAFVGLASPWDRTAEDLFNIKYLDLPVIGQLYGTKGELNLEQVAAADPQLVIDVGQPKGTIKEDLDALTEQVGVPFVHITANTANMGDAYRELGKLLGREAEAETLAAYCDDIYARTLAIADKVGQGNKTRVLYCLGESGSNIIAKGSYHGEVLDLLTDNVAVLEKPSPKGTGDEVDLEQMLIWDPEVILFAPEVDVESVAADPAWQALTAIQTGSYCSVPFGPYNWVGFPPSVQRYLGMLWLADQLYPEQTDYDLYEEVHGYYDLFYHCDLTREQYEGLMAESLLK